VFARGQPEMPGVSVEAEHEVDVDVIEFLWAGLALFDDDSADADATSWYLPRWLDLYSIPDARTRILRLLAETPEGHRLDELLPEAPDTGDSDGAEAETQPVLRRRSAWTSTLIASLELARQGEVTLAQDDTFAPIQVSPASAPAPARADGGTQPAAK
jgi:segregation and condensation protein A